MADLITILRRNEYGNPFGDNAVTGPYDPKPFPCLEKYVEIPKSDILQAIVAHEQNRLSNPLLIIFGYTGSGKSFLLRLLVRQNHEKKSHLWAQTKPTAMASSGLSAEDAAKVLWQSLVAATESANLPGFKPVRPLDCYGYLIGRKILQEEAGADSIVIESGWFGLFAKRLPKSVTSVFGKSEWQKGTVEKDAFPQQRLDQLCPDQNDKICQALCAKVEQWPQGEFPIMSCWLLAQAFGVTKLAETFYARLPVSWLDKVAQLIGLSRRLGISVLFVLDQFEDLFMVPGRYEDNFRNVLMRIQNFICEIRQGGTCCPLFLLAVAQDPANNVMSYIHDRCSFLPNGKKWIDITSDLGQNRFDLALDFAQLYLTHHAKLVAEKVPAEEKADVAYLAKDPLYPFTVADLQLLHQVMLKRTGNATVREWLNRCQEAWDRLIFTPCPDSLVERQKEWREEMKKELPPPPPPPPHPPTQHWPPLDQEFLQSVMATRKNVLKQDNAAHIAVFQDLLQAVSQLGLIKPAIGTPQVVQAITVGGDGTRKLEHLQFSVGATLCLLALSWKANPGGGIGNEWARLESFMKMSKEKYGRVLFLRTSQERFPPAVPGTFAGGEVRKVNLSEKEWQGIYAIIMLAQGKYKAQSNLSLLKMPPWFKPDSDYSEVAKKVFDETGVLQKLLK